MEGLSSIDRPYRIGLIGSGDANPDLAEIAYEVGYLIGSKKAVLICGGLGGVMEAGSKGCIEAGGLTIGVLPEKETDSANPYISIPIATGMGYARNLIIVLSSEVIIAVGGGFGTLSEIAYASKFKKHIIGIRTWANIPGLKYVSTPKEAVEMAFSFLSSSTSLS